MKNWSNLVTRQRLDAVAEAIQRLCLLVVIAVELLFFIPGEAVDEIVYLFLEWRLVDVSLLFLAASFCRRYLRQSKWYFLSALLVVIWFYLLRGVHLRLEGINQDPGAFVCAYLLCLPFAAAANDAEKGWGLKALSSVFTLTGAVFGVYAVLLVTNHLPSSLDGFVFWDGARFGVMGHPNICATLLMISMALSAGLALKSRRLWAWVLLAVLLIPQFAALSLTNGRTTIILTCLLMGGIAFCALRGRGWKRFAVALLAAVVVMAGLFGASRAIYGWNQTRLLQQVSAESAQQEAQTGIDATPDALVSEQYQGTLAGDLKTLNGRTEIWRTALRGLEENPGLKFIGTEYVDMILTRYAPLTIYHTHNSWLEVLYRMGLPGLAAALVITALTLWSAAVVLWRNTDLWKSCIALLALCLMGCAMLEPYLFVADVSYHYLDFLFLMCLGYLCLWRREKAA